MSSTVKSNSGTIYHNDHNVDFRDLPDARILFSLPQIEGADETAKEAARNSVHKHSLVKCAKLTRSGKLSAKVNERSLRKSRLTYNGLKKVLGEQIIDTMLHHVKHVKETQSQVEPSAQSRPSNGSRQGFLNDKTRTIPVPSPAS